MGLRELTYSLVKATLLFELFGRAFEVTTSIRYVFLQFGSSSRNFLKLFQSRTFYFGIVRFEIGAVVCRSRRCMQRISNVNKPFNRNHHLNQN